MSRPPSPCLDVCKYRLKGHCIACGMTKAQKASAERIPDAATMADFLVALRTQQAALGRAFWSWEAGYRQKCARAGVPCPVDGDGDGDGPA